MLFRNCIIPCFTRNESINQVSPHPQSGRDITEPGLIKRFEWSDVEALTAKFTSGVIGEGGFSTVYLGRLPNSTKITKSSKLKCGNNNAAFKVQRSSERLYRAFLQERDVLLRVRHPNIVQLLGYSDDSDEQGVLVFEYVPNGTLHEKLHSTLHVLPWSVRMSILFQIATAIEYLHEGCSLQIIHGDITASNVLLDGNMNPKLCDFGSARMGFSAAVKPENAGHVIGSPGYVDPYYLRTGIISKKSDVYSFGVLLMEMVTGMSAVGSGDGKLLTVEMRNRGRVVDPTLGMDYNADEVEMVSEIARRCVCDQPGLRPSMAEILRIMKDQHEFSVY